MIDLQNKSNIFWHAHKFAFTKMAGCRAVPPKNNFGSEKVGFHFCSW